jgi:hypothetical protein
LRLPRARRTDSAFAALYPLRYRVLAESVAQRVQRGERQILELLLERVDT